MVPTPSIGSLGIVDSCNPGGDAKSVTISLSLEFASSLWTPDSLESLWSISVDWDSLESSITAVESEPVENILVRSFEDGRGSVHSSVVVVLGDMILDREGEFGRSMAALLG